MPNWTYNTITTSQEVIHSIQKQHSTDSNKFDFNTFIKMPESLNVTSGSQNDYDIYYYLSEKCTLSSDEVKKNPLSSLISNMFSKDWIKEVEERVKNSVRHNELPSYETGKILCDNYLNYGAITWYGWCWDNWNTKWNACDAYYGNDGTLNFSTAWAPPIPIFEKLCKEFPNEEIEFYCEYEDGNFEVYRNQNGVLSLTDSGRLEFESEDE